MFLLVSGCHVGQSPYKIISMNLGDILLRIAGKLKTAETWFLARLFILQSSIISQILEFIYWTVMIFSFDHDWWKPRITSHYDTVYWAGLVVNLRFDHWTCRSTSWVWCIMSKLVKHFQLISNKIDVIFIFIVIPVSKWTARKPTTCQLKTQILIGLFHEWIKNQGWFMWYLLLYKSGKPGSSCICD